MTQRDFQTDAALLLAAVQGLKGMYGLAKPIAVLAGSMAKVGLPAVELDLAAGSGLVCACSVPERRN